MILISDNNASIVGDPAEIVMQLVQEEEAAGNYVINEMNSVKVIQDAARRLDKYYRQQAGRYAEGLNNNKDSRPQKQSDNQSKPNQKLKDRQIRGGSDSKRLKDSEPEDETFMNFLEREDRKERKLARTKR